MKLTFKPFDTFVQQHTVAKTRKRFSDSQILSLEVTNNQIDAEVLGTLAYQVRVKYDDKKVKEALCTCPYSQEGYCKHIIHTLVKADSVKNKAISLPKNTVEAKKSFFIRKDGKSFAIENKGVGELTPTDIKAISQKQTNSFWGYGFMDAKLDTNLLRAEIHDTFYDYYTLHISSEENTTYLRCSCTNNTEKICDHLHFALLEINTDGFLQLPFKQEYRQSLLEAKAKKMGIGEIENLEDFFSISWDNGRLFIQPKYSVLSLSEYNVGRLKGALLPDFHLPISKESKNKTEFIVVELDDVLGLSYTFMEAPLTKNGKMKSPVQDGDIQHKLKDLTQPEEFLFYTSLLQQNRYEKTDNIDTDIIKNPFKLPFYLYSRPAWGKEKITPKKLQSIQIKVGEVEATINVRKKEGFYTLTLRLKIEGKEYSSQKVKLYDRYFKMENQFLYIKNEMIHKVASFFEKNKHEIYLPQSQFPKFKTAFLNPLEQAVQVKYSFVKKAPKKIVKEQTLEEVKEHLIYLSDSEDYIIITPVAKYGKIEIPVLSRRNMYTEDKEGKMYSVDRDKNTEHRFIRNIQEHHPSFEEQTQNEFYYLHKQDFLENGWFMDAFESWRSKGYSILGFKDLKSNPNLNPNKMKVRTSLKSGIDWFDVHANISFGKQEVGLKEIQKSIKNKSRYVTLGDGTKGLLPQEWVDKFGRYFRSGEIKEDFLRTHKSQFSLIDELFENQVLSYEVKIELETYREKLANFHSIRNVKVPQKLNATLRDYQKEGLNWLNFLDEFGFGGCLADDMGLGKTIQLLAYFLSQIEKGKQKPNLVIVPTTLIYNWELEIKKFTPKLKYKIVYGIKRETKKVVFDKYDTIITSYGTMLNDIEILKEVEFNCIVLDESQAIKNPNSKRYKAARLLQGRQRIVATGTPVENNTFDLYAQLSFAMPGLFGSARQFAADYSTPIDKFQDEKRAKELQKKVHPFILRRTKKQVATELPEKTEMVIHCEMGKEQRRVYDTYKKEFQTFLKEKKEEELKSSSMHILQGLTKMRQICNSPALLSDEEYYGSQSAKLEELIAQVQQLHGEHKIIIFSQFVTMLNLIKERLIKEKIKFAYLTGQTRKRQEQVHLFQEDEETRVFLISLKAGGTGLNLTRAEYVFIVDPWWNPAVENQAIDRAYRIGQKNKVIAIRLITPESIEQKIMELQEHKKQLADDLIHTDSGFFKQLKKEDLMGMV